MEPVTTLIAAKLGADFLRGLASGFAQPQPAQQAQQAEQAAKFEQLLRQVASNPNVQKAAFLAAENIRTQEDAEFRLGDCATRILNDPAVQQALGGRTEPVEIRFLDQGMVELTTREGVKKLVRLEGNALRAANEARQILDCIHTARGTAQRPDTFGIRYIPGTGIATLL